MTARNAPKTRKKLKIAVLVRNLVATGGAERYAWQVSRRLARDHDVHVFCQTWDPDLTDGLTIHRVPRPVPGPSFLNQLIFSRYCGRMVDESFDIVHSHERVTRFDVLSIHCPCYKGFLTRARGLRKTLLWIGELTSPRGLSYLWLEKRQFTPARGRRYIADSALVRDDVTGNYGLPADLFTIAYPGVEFTALDRAIEATDRRETRRGFGIGENDFALLFVGTEFRRKGLDALIRAMAMIRDDRVRLVVAGGGDVGTYRAMAARLGVDGRVVFTGLVRDIYPLYIMADCFCLPTLSDPCPIAPVEAMACGTATIMSGLPWCGTAEHVGGDEAVLLGDPRDPEEIARAVARLLDPEERKAVAAKGRDLARGITWEAAAAATRAVFAQVMAERQRDA